MQAIDTRLSIPFPLEPGYKTNYLVFSWSSLRVSFLGHFKVYYTQSSKGIGGVDWHVSIGIAEVVIIARLYGGM